MRDKARYGLAVCLVVVGGADGFYAFLHTQGAAVQAHIVVFRVTKIPAGIVLVVGTAVFLQLVQILGRFAVDGPDAGFPGGG